MQNPKFKIERSTDDQHFFTLRAGNGEKILTSELYRARAGALGGIASVKENAPLDANYDRLPSVDGLGKLCAWTWYWTPKLPACS
jgi:uncharacterized protein